MIASFLVVTLLAVFLNSYFVSVMPCGFFLACVVVIYLMYYKLYPRGGILFDIGMFSLSFSSLTTNLLVCQKSLESGNFFLNKSDGSACILF